MPLCLNPWNALMVGKTQIHAKSRSPSPRVCSSKRGKTFLRGHLQNMVDLRSIASPFNPSALFQNIDVILPKLLDGAVESIESSRLGGRPYKTRCSGSSVLSVGVCMRVVRVPVHDTHTNKDWFRWNGYSYWIRSINIPDKAILSCNEGWNTSISCCNPVFLRFIYFIDFVWFTNALSLSLSLPFS